MFAFPPSSVPSIQFKGTLVFNDQHLKIPADAQSKGYYSVGSFGIHEKDFSTAIPAQENFNATYVAGARALLEKCAQALPDDYTLTYNAPPELEQLSLSVKRPLKDAMLYTYPEPKPTEIEQFTAGTLRLITQRPGGSILPWDTVSHGPELEKFKAWLPNAMNNLLGDIRKALAEMKKATETRIDELDQAKQAVTGVLGSDQ